MGSRGAESVVRATVEDLRRHAPFNEMDDASLIFMATAAKLGYYAKEELILGPERGPVKTLYVIQRGLVEAHIPGKADADRIELHAGECFSVGAVLGGRPTTMEYRATEDTFCYELAVDVVNELLDRSMPLRRFCTQHISSLLKQAGERLRQTYSEEAVGEEGMLRTLSTAVKRAPITCAPDAPLKVALETMQANKISAIVVAKDDGIPLGIFTERDLVKHTVAGQVDPARPISAFMTPDPIGLPLTATVAQAALVMAKRNIRHLLVLRDSRLAGVVSERSLFALQRLSMREVTHSIELATDVDGLKSAATEIRSLARNMLAQGVAAEQLTLLISALNDKLSERILELESARNPLGDVRFAWMALGSEGRQEQTFSSDQDNAIIFETPEGTAPQAIRDRLLPFARAVNETLDACGFPLCKGEIMASNPKWCLSVEEWGQQFSNWIRNPTPQALLNASIFFDFRGIWGEARLVAALRDWLKQQTRGNERFLHMMAANALTTEPPLGFFGDLVTSGEGEEKGTVDLKAQGTRIIIDVARIYSLAQGVEATNTAERIRQTAGPLGIKPEESEAVIDAGYFLLLLRLRRQHLEGPEGVSPNRINPRELNELDLRILKESLRQARKMQKRLKLDYQL